MKSISISNLLVLLFAIIGLSLPTNAKSQHRIPNKGENIQFFPIVEEERVNLRGYDCFFVENLVCKNGQFIFKKKFRFKKDRDMLTPLSEIENYTFYVRETKIVSINNKQVMLIYLTRNEDKEKIVMRLHLDNSKENNELTNSMFVYKKVEKEWDPFKGWSYEYVIERINLGYINVDSFAMSKERYTQQNIFYYPYKENKANNIYKHLNEFAKIINKDSYIFKQDIPYLVTEIGFMNVFENSMSKVPCAVLKSPDNIFLKIPLCYFDLESTQTKYLIPELFITEEAFKKKELAYYGLHSLKKEYIGKQVYYGLDFSFTSDQLKGCKTTIGNRKYQLSKGLYKSIDFILQTDDNNKRNPYAILEDTNGIVFKVRINATSQSRYYCADENCFNMYFAHVHLADSIIAERNRIEQETRTQEIEKRKSLIKEFGEKNAVYLSELNDEDIARFRMLRKKYGASNAKAILEKKFHIGWTKEMVIESIGHPFDINRSVGPWGTHEQWVYRLYKYIDDSTYLYFENGILTSFQE